MSRTVEPRPPDLFENLRLELRRGCLVIAVLSALRAEQYGYTLRKELVELNAGGREMLKRLLAEWRAIDASLHGILKEQSDGSARALPGRR
jgi:hypothetical protein